MALTTEERNTLAAHARTAMTTVEEVFHLYAKGASAPVRFAIGVYDASDAGPGYAERAAVADRAIAEFKIGEDQWGDRNYLNTARGKIGVALRTGRNTGDLARGNPELFQEGEPKFPGAVLGEVAGKPVAVAGSGLRGPEDEALSHLLVELLKRLTS
jgi:hypothetical protein